MHKRSNSTLEPPTETQDSGLDVPPANTATARPGVPLAARMRPRTLDEIVGQEHLLAPGQALRRAIEADRLPFARPLGAPGQRQDHAGPRHRHHHQRLLRARQRRIGGRGRPPPDRQGSAGAARRSTAGAPSSSSTRSTASTRASRTPSCPTSKTARSP